MYKAEKVEDIKRNGSRISQGQIACKLRQMEFKHPICQITVAQTFPKDKEGGGWQEFTQDIPDLVGVGKPDEPTEIWIKTSTHKGPRKIYFR